MFSVYGISGPVLLETLETMTRVRPLQRTSEVHAISAQDEVLGVESVRRQADAAALRAYREMLRGDLERGPLYHAAQVMHGAVITVAADDAVARAWRVLRDGRIHQAPVLDDAENLVGIVSERDLLTAIDIDGERVIETLRRQVRDVMTTPVVAASPATDIRRIAAVMLEHDVDGVPVVNDSGRLVGFISRGDVLRAVVTEPPLSLWR